MKATVEKQLEKKWINKINSLKKEIKKEYWACNVQKNLKKKEQIIRKYY